MYTNMWVSLLGDIYNIRHPFCQQHWQNSWLPVSKSPLSMCARRKCVRSECRAQALFLWGCCSVTHYSLILSSLTWLTRYRACDAPVTNHSLPLTTALFVCWRCFRRFLILCFYVYSTSYCMLFVYKRLVIYLLIFGGSSYSLWQPVFEFVYVVLQYVYFVYVVMYTQKMYCMWNPWSLSHPRAMLSEGCTVSAAWLSRPCVQSLLLMTFTGAANELPCH